MGEAERVPRQSDQRPILLGVVIAVLVVIAFFFFFRGCTGKRASDMTTLYTNLDLKDAASVVGKLKALKIPYELKDDGRAVAVPKDKADDARLSLAQENLPAGGTVGWEIFDQTRLGATDFDRRVQLIRAISGELSRTIRRLEAVEDARVQIVIPRTELFEVEKAPVTASVLLKLHPGRSLSSRQINGIVHLVANSVENLSPSNVTIVDIYGNILTAAKAEETTGAMAPAASHVVSSEVTRLEKPSVSAPPSPEVVTIPKTLSPEERVAVIMKSRELLENRLTDHVQRLLNQFYPQGTVITRVNVDLVVPEKSLPPAPPVRRWKRNLRWSRKPVPIQVQGGVIRKMSVIVLVDNRLSMDADLKQSTFATVSAAIGYDRARGDHIELRQVPFQAALPPEPPAKTTPASPTVSLPSWAGWLGGAVLFLILLRAVRRSRRRLQAAAAGPSAMAPRMAGGPAPGAENSGAGPVVSEIRQMAQENPERIAELLKQWLGEEVKR